MSTETARPTCTCLPLNRRLMAHLLKVDEGSVHEQGCVDAAVAEATEAGYLAGWNAANTARDLLEKAAE